MEEARLRFGEDDIESFKGTSFDEKKDHSVLSFASY